MGARAREESVMQATVLLSSNTQLEEVKKFAYTGWTKCLVKSAIIQYSTRNAQVRLTLKRFKEDCKEPDKVSD